MMPAAAKQKSGGTKKYVTSLQSSHGTSPNLALIVERTHLMKTVNSHLVAATRNAVNVVVERKNKTTRHPVLPLMP
jgi:hypothetical protein